MVWVVGRWSSYLIASSFPRKCDNIGVGRSETGMGKIFEMTKHLWEIPFRDLYS